MRKRLLSLLFILSIVEVAQAVKIVYGPYLQMVGETEASIVWVTDTKALSWVEIAPDDKMNFYAERRPQFFETYLGRKVLGTVHKVKLTGLTKGTTYRYRIFSQEVLEEQDYQITYGAIASTNVYTKAPLTFRTLDGSQEKVNFFVVNDIHGDNAKFNALLKEVKKGETDFVLFNGDMVSHMDSEQQMFEGFVTSAVEMFASETPFYMVRGNHESRGKFAQNYMDYFPTPTGLPYYAFKQGPIFFIVMDGGEDKPDNDIEYLGTAAFDAYREDEAAWLQEVVASEAFKSAPFRVVVIHVPPTQSTWHGPLHTKKTFVPILNEAGVDLMLSAHLHRYIYAEPGADGCNFPLLINSNKHVLDVSADQETMKVVVKDDTGKVENSYTYRSKRSAAK